MTGTLSLSLGLMAGAKFLGDANVKYTPIGVVVAGACLALFFSRLWAGGARKAKGAARAVVVAGLVGGTSLAVAGAVPLLVRNGLLDGSRAYTSTYITMTASCCFLAANSLKLATMRFGQPG